MVYECRRLLLPLVVILSVGLLPAKAQPVPELGVCASINDANLIKKYGYDFIQPTVAEALLPFAADSLFDRQLTANPSPVSVMALNVFIPGALKTTGPEVDEVRTLAYVDKVFQRARRLGCRVMVFGSGASRRIPEGFPRDSAFRQFVSISKKLAVLAEKYGIVLALESQNREECNFLNKVSECLQVARAVNHPHFKLCIDIYHMMREDEGPAVIEAAGDLVYHCDIGEKATRSAPGVAGDDFTPYFKAFQNIGYKGAIALECRFTDLNRELPLARRRIQEQWEAARQQH